MDFKIEKSIVQFPNSFEIVVKRGVKGEDFTGFKLVFQSEDSSEVFSYNISLSNLESRKVPVNFSELSIISAKKISLAPYIIDENGKEKILGVSDVKTLDLFSLATYTDEGFLLNGGAESGDTSYFSGIDEVISEDCHNGEYCFSDASGSMIVSSQFFPVEVDKNYHLEGWFKSEGIDKSRLYYGFIPYDENMRFISHSSVHAVTGTETTLYEDVLSDDIVIKLASCENWRDDIWHSSIAYEVDDSGNYDDLPNFKLSGYNVSKITVYPDYCEVEFGTRYQNTSYEIQYTAGHSFPAGTKVRQHHSGSTYMYTAASSDYVPYSWTKYEGDASGMTNEGASSIKWRKSTKYALVHILTNYNQTYSGNPYDVNLLIDDMKLVVS
jgi:hypothetical protein